MIPDDLRPSQVEIVLIELKVEAEAVLELGGRKTRMTWRSHEWRIVMIPAGQVEFAPSELKVDAEEVPDSAAGGLPRRTWRWHTSRLRTGSEGCGVFAWRS
jgi:hypothetical protein